MKFNAETFSILFLFTSNVVTVNLPGQCPDVPASEIAYKTPDLQPTILHSIPFEESPSYLFRDIGGNKKSMFTLTFIWMENQTTNVPGEIFFRYLNHPSYALYFNPKSVDHRHKSYTYENNIEDLSKPESGTNTSSCHNQINETLTMWFDGDLVILWSCRESVRNKSTHDEAFMVATYNPGENFPPGNLLQQKNKVAEMSKRLSLEKVVGHIRWPNVSMIFETSTKEIPFLCPKNWEWKIIAKSFVPICTVIGIILFGSIVYYVKMTR